MIDYYEHIESYLEGTLDPTLKAQMDIAISQNSELKQAVADYPIAKMITESLIENEVRSVLAQENLKPPVRRGKYGPWIITITLISALAVSYYQWNRHTRQTKLYATVMENYSPPINKGSRGDNSTGLKLDEAIKAFDIRDFQTSKELFKSIKPKTDSIYWYLGHIALINGDIYEAKHHSKKISDANLRADISQYVDQVLGRTK